MKNKEKDVLYCNVDTQKIANFETKNINADTLDIFLYFVSERYKIHLKKDIQGLTQPWTKDPILRKYRFTNVRREHDTNTRWVIDNICNTELKYGQKLANIVLFRIFNKISTAEFLGLPIANIPALDAISVAEEIEHSLPEITPYTGAYLCSGMKKHMKLYTGTDSSIEAALLIVQEMCENRFWKGTKAAHSPEEIIENLQQYAGISEFLSYQIFVDFTYLDEFPFSENEFTIAGIGARSGLRVLFGGKRAHGLTPEELIFWMRDHWKELNQYNLQNGGKHTLNPKILFTDLPEEDRCMNVMSIENCLCEFHKYYKVMHKLGRPRQKYQGGKNG